MTTARRRTAWGPMAKWGRGLLLLLICLSVVSCGGERLVVFSPDGKTAAVTNAQGLRLCDADGNLTPLLVPEVVRVMWASDRSLWAVVREPRKDWAAARAVVAPEEAARVEAISVEMRRWLLTYAGTLKELATPEGPMGELFQRGTAAELITALGLLRDDKEVMARRGAEIDELLKDTVGVPLFTLRRYEVSSDRKLTPADVAVTSLREMAELLPRPGSSGVAWVEEGTKSEERVLRLWSGVGRVDRLADRVAAFPAWTLDGQSVFYVRAATLSPDDDKAPRVGKLCSVDVDRLARAGDSTPEGDARTVLLETIFDPGARLRVLPDGRLLMSGVRASFPAKPESIPARAELLIVDPANLDEVVPAIAPGEGEGLPEFVQRFEVSPDGQRVAIPGPEGEIAVVDLATGKVKLVAGGVEGGKLALAAVWRSDGAGGAELCYGVPSTVRDAARPVEVMLWNGKVSRKLSARWPDEVVAGMK